MKTLSCVCYADKKSSKKIQRLMTSISDKCNSTRALRFKPHFSIRNDFKVKNSDLEKLITETALVTKIYKKFTISLCKYGFYPWKIIFLDISKSRMLQELHDDLMNKIQKFRTPWVSENLLKSMYFTGKQRKYVENFGYQFAFEYYSPHFTLAGHDMSQKDFDKMKSVLKNKTENIKVHVNKITFVDRDDDNKTVKDLYLSS